MDPSNRTLDSMISVPHPSQIGDFVESTYSGDDRPSKRRALAVDVDQDDGALEEAEIDVASTAWTKGSVVIPESECEFTSIQELRQEIKKGNEGKVHTECLE